MSSAAVMAQRPSGSFVATARCCSPTAPCTAPPPGRPPAPPMPRRNGTAPLREKWPSGGSAPLPAGPAGPAAPGRPTGHKSASDAATSGARPWNEQDDPLHGAGREHGRGALADGSVGPRPRWVASRRSTAAGLFPALFGPHGVGVTPWQRRGPRRRRSAFRGQMACAGSALSRARPCRSLRRSPWRTRMAHRAWPAGRPPAPRAAHPG